MTEELLYESNEGVLTVTINRPHKKNAITYDMYRSLTEALKKTGADPQIHAVIITGTGNIFSAGNDIKSFVDNVNLPYKERPSIDFMNTVATFSKPLIGAVNGDAIGISATLLLHCDLIYSVTGANIKMPFLSLGAVPEFASSTLLARQIGHTKAFELFTLNQSLTSDEAHRLNWFNEIAPADELMKIATRSARKLAATHPSAVLATKQLMKQPDNAKILDIIDREAATFVERMKSPEVQAIFAAFMNRSTH